jgi:L-aspartate oxidase
MERYDKRKDLAPRDIVARAIDNEMKINGTEHVYLDCTHFTKDSFTAHFPNIYAKCLSIGIDITKDMIPVAPAAHYSCGGIKTDEWARTSINNLYSAGECASTGLHGANRLASNSLLEAMVFAHNAYKHSVNAIRIPENAMLSEVNNQKKLDTAKVPNWKSEGTNAPKEMILITQSVKELKLLMSDYVGIVRNNERLYRAMKRLDLLYEETEALYEKTAVSPQLCELRNMITVAYLIVKCADFRHESRGLHYNIDYPDKSKMIQNIVL